MSRFARWSVLASVSLLAITYSAASAASAPPKLRLAEVQEIAPTGYRVDLTLDPSKDSFAGTIAIKLDVKKPTQTIWLNANKIQVQDASLVAGGKTMVGKSLDGGDDYIGLEFDSPVPAGPAAILIRYSGTVRQGDTAGVFRTVDSGNSYLLTQFESTDARGAFPCFDEPSYKVPWQLTLHVPVEHKAVSNTPVVNETDEGGTKTYVFAETKPLPSYLVAFGVGPFEFVDGGYAGKNRVPVRIVTPKGHANEAKYAAEVTATILTRLEDYFGIPFPYEKSDQVAVPALAFGAMENPGMVTYGQTLILAKPETDSIARQRLYATVAAHELAHQWFGDLVTPEWWDDIWLNESFATWMEQKLIAEWKPEWKTRQGDVDSKLFAQREDSLMSARKIRQAIQSKDDIQNAFDGITYQKGASVIAMFEGSVGPETFRKGVQNYLTRYSFRTANAGNFLESVSAAAKKDVMSSFSTFLDQAGVPMVSVALDCNQRKPVLRLGQVRFLPVGSKGSADEVWHIPVCVRYGGDGRSQSACTVMTQASLDWVLNDASSCPAWVQANDNAKGYYRVNYQGGLLSALTSGDVVNRLHATERVDLMGNAQAMSDAGKLSPADALELVQVFHTDPERGVLERALEVAMSIRRDMVADNLVANYQRFLRKNFQARARELGWVPRPGEPDDVRLLRPTLVAAVATAGGDQDLAKQAEELAGKWLENRGAVNPEVVGAVLSTSAYHGDRTLFERFLAEFKRSKDRQDQEQLMQAMTSFRDSTAIQSGLQAVVSGDIALLDGFPLLLSQNSAATRKLAFEFIKAHFDQITANHPIVFGFDLGAFLPHVGDAFCDKESRGELQAFFDPLVGKYVGAPRELKQVLERIDLCIAKKAAQQPSVAMFLEKY